MNEKSPHSRGNGDGSTVVLGAVFTVFVVLFVALVLGGLFIFYFTVPVSDAIRPASQNAVTTNAVTTAQYEPVEIQEETDEAVSGPPLATDVRSTPEAIDAVPEEEPDRTDVENVPEGPEHAVAPAAEPVSKPSDVTPPTDETVEDDTMPPDETVKENTQPPAETAEEDAKPPAEKETTEGESYQSLPEASETVGVKADGGDARGSVAFSGRKCESVIWAQPDEDQGESRVGYMLDGKFATLRGTAGICDTADEAGGGGKKPSAVFRIYGDGNLLWESDPQTGFGAAQQFEVDVKGIEFLALVAESSSSSKSSRFAWGDVELKATKE